MIVWGIGERGNLDSISIHSSRDTAASGVLQLMEDKGPGWTWVLDFDLDDLIQMTGTGPAMELSELIGIRREVLP